MRDASAELKSVHVHWPDAELIGDEKKPYLFLPKLLVMANGQAKDLVALLQPWAGNDGYLTRLFFSERFSSKGQNWNVFNILGRTWHAPSWQGVPEDIAWLDMIISHLRPLQ